MSKAGPSLVGKSVVLKLSDPWELGEVVAWKPLLGMVEAEGQRPESSFGKAGETIILQLEHPFVFGDMEYKYLQGSPRHAGGCLSDLASGKRELCCSFVRIPESQIRKNTNLT